MGSVHVPANFGSQSASFLEMKRLFGVFWSLLLGFVDCLLESYWLLYESFIRAKSWVLVLEKLGFRNLLMVGKEFSLTSPL